MDANGRDAGGQSYTLSKRDENYAKNVAAGIIDPTVREVDDVRLEQGPAPAELQSVQKFDQKPAEPDSSSPGLGGGGAAVAPEEEYKERRGGLRTCPMCPNMIPAPGNVIVGIGSGVAVGLAVSALPVSVLLLGTLALTTQIKSSNDVSGHFRSAEFAAGAVGRLKGGTPGLEGAKALYADTRGSLVFKAPQQGSSAR